MNGRTPLPIDPVLPEVADALRLGRPVLLASPPGTGKTTRVPQALLAAFPEGEIVVLEPRRIAARAAAARVAEELGSPLGEVAGYQVRGETRAGRHTRIRFVTEGVLVRRLVRDPFLEGIAVVCLDEFHERHLEGDLALAMCKESRDAVRPDLRLCVMSATLDPAPLRAFLGDVVEVRATAPMFPVEVVHDRVPDPSPLQERVRAAVEKALAATGGDVLVFLPGTGEIVRCEDALANLARRLDVAVLPLHGRLDLDAQQRALRPADRRKVVLATNVAESSLTIPGVTAVVDTGLAREARHDRGRGVTVLEVERISLASAAQRTGRAGRTAPGVCYRLWTAGEERGMAAQSQPEVKRADLAGAALLVRAFAGRDPRAFGWFEPPPADALAAADALLSDLGAFEPATGVLTTRGRALLDVPLHPRLAAVAVAGVERRCARAAATAAVLLADADDLGRGPEGADLVAATDAFLAAEGRGFPEHACRELGLRPWAARTLQATRDRVLAAAAGPGDRHGHGGRDDGAHRHGALERCLLAGFPDRVAARGGEQARTATMTGGRGILLPPAADGHELVLALRLFESGRQSRSQATLTAAIEEEWLAAEGLLREETAAELDEANGRVVAVRRTAYRDLALRSARGGELDGDAAHALLAPMLAKDPWRWLGEQKALRALLARSRWLRERAPELSLPSWDDEAVGAAAAELLAGASDLRALRDADVLSVLLARLDRPQRQALERHAPATLVLPSGRAAPIDYGAPAGPTVAARLQEFFGLPSVSALAGGRVPVVLELLGPNHRPVQVTTDLPSFWTNVYPQVKKELARRYPRHHWPDDPLAAVPRVHVKHRPPRPR